MAEFTVLRASENHLDGEVIQPSKDCLILFKYTPNPHAIPSPNPRRYLFMEQVADAVHEVHGCPLALQWLTQSPWHQG